MTTHNTLTYRSVGQLSPGPFSMLHSTNILLRTMNDEFNVSHALALNRKQGEYFAIHFIILTGRCYYVGFKTNMNS